MEYGNEELRNLYRILVGKPQGEKSLPIPKHEIECDISDINEILYEDLTNSERFQYRFIDL
jgi:hypothetical protein